MKKPKDITKGEWYVASDGLIVTKDDDGTELLIADIDYMGADKSECEANRKAIAQVPNMIDEIIKSNELLSELLGIIIEPEAVKLLKDQYEKNKQVLTDAGCEL